MDRSAADAQHDSAALRSAVVVQLCGPASAAGSVEAAGDADAVGDGAEAFAFEPAAGRLADAAGVSPNLITRYFGGKDGIFLAAARVEIPVGQPFDGDRAALGARLAASIVERWFSLPAHDPLLVLQRAAGERPEAAETLASFLDENSLEPLCDYLRKSGMDEAAARDRAAAVDAFVLGVSTRRRILRSELGDRAGLQAWLGAVIQRIIDT